MSRSKDVTAIDVNHEEAIKTALLKKDSSNLARCYIELTKINQALSERLGIFGPFITGISQTFSKNGMPIDIYVSPQYGTDGVAKYRLIRDYETLLDE